MSSSGLIYAVIVGAWAAYLVPMWLRRQDELNEARPTERFSTAIRLLAGRSGLERRAARALGDEPRDDEHSSDGPPGRDGAASGDPAADSAPPAVEPESSASVEPPPAPVPVPVSATAPVPSPERGARGERPGSAPHGGAQRRARLLARRRRMVTALFLAFALGAVVAAVAGLAFLWVPAVPATLLTLYIGHLRKLERQRYEVKLDRARAAQAAERLRKREQQRAAARSVPAEAVDTQAHTQVHTQPHVRAHAPARAQAPAAEGRAGRRPHLRLAADPGEAAVSAPSASAPSASAVAEATEHEEWVDGMRERGAAGPDSWEPVPVPLPTYVTAPVAPRVSRGLDLTAPGTWTAGRPAESARNTPLFDQYAEPSAPEIRPRAANE
ncbi:gephyrin-like molybdotransferase receptor GlpR [Kitasatospora sp. NPDC059803]|uniref:divisome protein SepX/GlpR n=1 Tax=Kitasatospora sp. NPDC059803 TaxID=3346953 RepID=UPI00364C14BE